MRLSQKEIVAIVHSFKTLFPDIDYQVYLFGSRVDDSKKGGDIDLLVVTKTKEQKTLIVDAKTKVKMKLLESLEDQKIDITVASTDELKSDLFLRDVFPTAILLTELILPKRTDS